MSSAMNQSLKALHDNLLAEKPEGAVHDSDGCPLCALEEPTSGGGEVTYTEDDLRAKVDEAVAAAVAERDARINDLTALAALTDKDVAIQAAVAEKDKEIADLRADLDKTVLELANARSEHDALLQYLEAEKAAAEEAAAIEARKDERLKALKEVASFPDDYLANNADRFAAMADDEFQSRLTEYAALSGAKPAGSGEIPSGTQGLKAGLEGPDLGGRSSAVKELLALRRDPRGHVDLSSL